MKTRFPRTLQEAFGPYTDSHFYETRSTPRWHALAWAAVCIAATVCIALILSRGV